MLDLVVDRVRSGSRPGERQDTAVLALVVEGGGMRGVVSGGMVTALAELGARHAFDVVVGTSAGALAGAYFLADQPALGTSIYYEDLVGSEFINFQRAVRGGPLVSLEFLLDDVMRERKPLDSDAVLRSPTPLRAVVTRCRDYQAVTLGSFQTEAELREALRASARIALACGPPVTIGEEAYVDGSVMQSIPFRTAQEGDATHVLALLTRPRGQLRRLPKTWQKALVLSVMNRQMPGLGDAHLLCAYNYKREVDELQRLSCAATGPPFAYAIQTPEDAVTVHQLDKDPDRLFAGAAAGARAVYAALTGDHPRFHRALTAH